jgi:hypothetical protein
MLLCIIHISQTIISRVFHEKMTTVWLLEKLPASYRTNRFITILITPPLSKFHNEQWKTGLKNFRFPQQRL